MREVALDTSTASEIFNSPTLRDAFVAAVVRRRQRVVLSFETVCELISAPDQLRNAARAEQITSFAESLPLLVVADQLRDIVRREAANRPTHQTPLPTLAGRDAIAQMIARAAVPHAAFGDLETHRTFLGKRASLDFAKRVRDRTRPKLTGVEDLRLATIRADLNRLTFVECERVTSGVARRRAHWERMQRHPRGNRTSVYYAAGLALLILGSAVADRIPEESRGVLSPPRENNWVDARITAASAYADVFISEDFGQRARAAVIREVFSFGPRVCDLRQWLAGQ